jgi:hypothetical protein
MFLKMQIKKVNFNVTAKMLDFLAKNLPKLKTCGTDLALEIAMSKPRFDRVERDRRKSYNHDRRRFTKLTPSSSGIHTLLK